MKTILETTRESGGFLILSKAIETAGLADLLKEAGPYTLFAPTDGAFSRLPAGAIDELMEDPETLRMILRYHIVPEKLTLEMLVPKRYLSTLDGEEVTVGESVYGPLINDSNIITPDIECSNGIMHVVNYLLFPNKIRVRGGL